MPPQQPSPGSGPTMPAPPSGGQYDFIMDYGAHRPSDPLTNASTSKRIMIVVGGIVLLAIVAWILISILSKPAGTNPASLLPIVQEQAELMRISQTPAQAAANPPTQNLAQTISLVMQTEQAAFLAYMKARGVNESPTVLAATKSSATDSTLSQAQSTGTYDATYISIAQTEITAYQQSLSRAYATNTGVNARQLLKTAYDQTPLLLTMSKQH